MKRASRKAHGNGNGSGNGHAKSRPTCYALETCRPRFLSLEQESAQVSSTLGLLLQAQETTTAQLKQLTEGVAVLGEGVRLVCQAHDLNVDTLKN